MVLRGFGGSPNARYPAALAVAIMLLAGFSAAKADELSELRADRQLLQQQFDRLQGTAPAPTPGAQPAARPPVVGGSFPRSFVIPGTDTSVSFSGSVQSNFGFGVSH
jgi:hypothetical protein